ncbi:TPA: helix-turn-helix domain-containing protein [Klebsiella aerogenes]|uniref:helix-turn-helix domain-containing protein n=1 Tax=Enterobacteriaceae TaxID=543 RepID=UPI0005F0494D|nr:helix-turn-helix domain-containing protein [Klebsiella aerogenes]KJO59158.1 hypothetical protein SR89_09990 [Klebsiella aerogenes]HBV9946235.1 helix-turn-helix domain-containing protein [Klebsiella aerogenes]
MQKVNSSNVNSVSGEQINNEEKLAEYMQANQPKGHRFSKLDPVKPYILLLHRDGYSHDQIAAFMKIIGISAHSTTVGRFIRKFSSDEIANSENEVSKPKLAGNTIQPQQLKPSQPRGLANLDELSRPSEKSAKYTPYQGNTGNKE